MEATAIGFERDDSILAEAVEIDKNRFKKYSGEISTRGQVLH